MTSHPISRRSILAGGVTLLLAAPGLAAVTEAAARGLIEALVAELLAMAGSGEDQNQKRRRFRALLARSMAVEAVARTVLGSAWKPLDETRRAAFVEAFQDYVARKYTPRFNEFAQTRMEIIKVTDFGDRGVVVASRALLPSGEQAIVDWGVTDRGGSLKVANIVVEGVSLLTSEKEIVAGMLEKRQNDIDQLIADLKTGG